MAVVSELRIGRGSAGGRASRASACRRCQADPSRAMRYPLRGVHHRDGFQSRALRDGLTYDAVLSTLKRRLISSGQELSGGERR